MIYTLTKQEFIDFMGSDQGFSYTGLSTLYDHLEELEADYGEKIEFDKVAFRSYYSEVEISELWEMLNLFFEEDEKQDMDLCYEKIEDELNSRGIWFENLNNGCYLLEDGMI